MLVIQLHMKSRPILILALSAMFSSLTAAEKSSSDHSARIDELVATHLASKSLEPRPLTDDATFVRRIHLDLIGRIPTRAESLAFLQSTDPDKRTHLIDSLIGSDGYVSHQYHFWADLLRLRTAISGTPQSNEAGMAYEQWIKRAIRENRPYTEIVYELVTGSGDPWTNPASAYYLRDYGMSLDNTAITSQVFLGTQIVCAQCHDHPFDSWTQMDYYHLSAFTNGVFGSNNHPLQDKALDLLKKRKGKISETERTELRKAASEILFPVRFTQVVRRDRDLRLPHDYQYDDAKPKDVVSPATLLGPSVVLKDGEDKVAAYGAWLTSPDNPRFTQVMSNRLWKAAFGIGLIEPLDDLKDQTTPAIPELMTYLESLFKELDYDIQAFQKAIYNTQTYQREAVLEEPVLGALFDFAGPLLRRMSAAQIWDSLAAMTLDEVDAPSAARVLETERAVATVQLTAEAIYDQSPAQFLGNMIEVRKLQKELAGEIAVAVGKVAAAKEAGDAETIRAAQVEAREIDRRLAKLIEERVYREGLTEKIQLLGLDKDKAALAAPVSSDPVLLASSEVDEQALLRDLAAAVTRADPDPEVGMDRLLGEGPEGRGIIDQLIEAMFAEKDAALTEVRIQEKRAQQKAWKVESKDDIKAYQVFVTASKRINRASEMPSPSPPGHFLREFGQSDRELVNNSHDQASVTQALALLNGPSLSAVTNKYSVLSRDMAGHPFGERLEIIYQTMLSRAPTPAERDIFKEAWAADPESGSVTGIVWTLLNTRQFLFYN